MMTVPIKRSLLSSPSIRKLFRDVSCPLIEIEDDCRRSSGRFPLLSELGGPFVRPGSDLCEPDKIPAVERKILHRSFVDEYRDRRRLRLQQWRLRSDGDVFLDGTDLEFQAESKAVADSQRDITVDCFETLQVGRHPVTTRRKSKNLKIALGSVTAVSTFPVAALRAVTVTPGSNAPVESVTVPTTSAVVTCASADAGHKLNVNTPRSNCTACPLFHERHGGSSSSARSARNDRLRTH